MSKAIIVYGSTTGNTESTAEMIEKELSKNGIDTLVKDVSDTNTSELKDYDLVLFGCSTWGEDEIELQDDFQPFYEEINSSNISGKKVAVFGCGDSSYTYFCGAVDAIEEKVKDSGGEIITEGLKIDGDPDDFTDDITSWAQSVSNS